MFLSFQTLCLKFLRDASLPRATRIPRLSSLPHPTPSPLLASPTRLLCFTSDRPKDSVGHSVILESVARHGKEYRLSTFDFLRTPRTNFPDPSTRKFDGRFSFRDIQYNFFALSARDNCLFVCTLSRSSWAN